MKKTDNDLKLEMNNLIEYVVNKLNGLAPGGRFTTDDLRDKMVADLSIQRELAHSIVGFVGRNLNGFSIRPGKNGGIYRDK